jgi:hypothetical protein
MAEPRGRTKETIQKEQQKLWEKVWWNRHMACGEPEAGRNKARTLEDKYGKEFLIPKSEIEWGICLGKMMALAWVLVRNGTRREIRKNEIRKDE